jgi:hypothetical protein
LGKTLLADLGVKEKKRAALLPVVAVRKKNEEAIIVIGWDDVVSISMED